MLGKNVIQKMAECVINEYNQFCPFNGTDAKIKCVDGYRTQGENIADNGGIHTAYRAFKSYENRNGPEPLLDDPYLQQFNHDQLFFIAFARTWCGAITERELQQQIMSDVHSPGMYRVIGTLMNYPAFRAAFECPTNTIYAPPLHCDVWVSENAADYGIPKHKAENELNIPEAEQIEPVGAHKGAYDYYYGTFQLLSKSMNLSRDPCDNFYEYTCESFTEKSQFDAGDVTNLQIMADKMEKDACDGPCEDTALNKTYIFYKKCKEARSNFEELIKDGAIIKSEIASFARKTGLKFSMIYNQSSQEDQNIYREILGTALGYLSARGVDTLITPLIDTEWSSAEKYLFFIDQNTLTYPKSYYEPEAWNAIYKDFKKNVIDLFNQCAAVDKIQLNQAILDTDVHSLLVFERELALYYSTSEKERRIYNRSYNRRDVHEVQYQNQFINFDSYFTNLANGYAEYADYFKNNPIISIMEVDMLKKLGDNFPRLSGNVIANYFFYRLLHANREYIPKPSNYKEITILVEEERPRIGRRRNNFKMFTDKLNTVRLTCAAETVQYLPYANARFFLDALYPTDESKHQLRVLISGLIKNILYSFQGMIDRLEWMDAQSKEGAYAKIKNIQLNIAYPDFIVDNRRLNEYYARLYFQPNDSYFMLLERLKRFNYELQPRMLVENRNVERNDFLGPPGIINAWYQPELNSITIPLGIINTVFYNSYRPKSINYGMLGLVVGHELTHGFDDQGVQWDALGHLREWLTPESKEAFSKMANCVIKQYNTFCPLDGEDYSPKCINGDQTQGENIADNGGIHAAWVAYENYVALNGPDERLPDPHFAHFNHDQLFFLAFGEAWCRKTPSKEAMYRQLMTDVHSPAKYRILGTIQNHPAFRKAFNCKEGCMYAPKEFCSVWVPED